MAYVVRQSKKPVYPYLLRHLNSERANQVCRREGKTPVTWQGLHYIIALTLGSLVFWFINRLKL